MSCSPDGRRKQVMTLHSQTFDLTRSLSNDDFIRSVAKMPEELIGIRLFQLGKETVKMLKCYEFFTKG